MIRSGVGPCPLVCRLWRPATSVVQVSNDRSARGGEQATDRFAIVHIDPDVANTIDDSPGAQDEVKPDAVPQTVSIPAIVPVRESIAAIGVLVSVEVHEAGIQQCR